MKRLLKFVFFFAALGGGTLWYFENQGIITFATVPTVEPVQAAADEPQSFHDRFEASLKDLKIEDTKVGTGEVASPGKPLKIHYVGKLSDGKEFDSSIGRNDPLVFVLGRAEALPGLDRGIVGMRVGGKHRLTIPPFLGYGQNGVGTLVPPDATLVFEVELLAIGSERNGGKKVARAEKKSLSKERRPAKSRSKSHRRA